MDGMSQDQVMTDERLESLERWKDDMERRFAEAFPGGDHIGHCRYHALMIEDIEEKRRLRRAVMEKTIAALVWSAIFGLGIAVWQYLKTMLKA
jgi:hypothetical protein